MADKRKSPKGDPVQARLKRVLAAIEATRTALRQESRAA